MMKLATRLSLVVMACGLGSYIIPVLAHCLGITNVAVIATSTAMGTISAGILGILFTEPKEGEAE